MARGSACPPARSPTARAPAPAWCRSSCLTAACRSGRSLLRPPDDDPTAGEPRHDLEPHDLTALHLERGGAQALVIRPRDECDVPPPLRDVGGAHAEARVAARAHLA